MSNVWADIYKVTKMSHSNFSSDSEDEMEEEHVKKVSQAINN